MRQSYLIRFSGILILGIVTLVAACAVSNTDSNPLTFDNVTLKLMPRSQVSLVDPQDGREYFQLVPDQHAAQYFLPLKVGGQDIPVVADTGSSNLILQGPERLCGSCSLPAYNPTPGAIDLVKGFSLAYGSGRGTVAEYEDVTSFSGDEPPIPYRFGILTQNVNLPNILGLAYHSIAKPTDEALQPFFDQLLKARAGKLHNIFSMLLCGRLNGSTVIIGNSDKRIQPSSIAYVPIVQETYYVVDARFIKVLGWSKSGNEWQVSTDVAGHVGDFPAFVPDVKGGPVTIVDSGSTMNILPPEIVDNAVALMKKVVTTKGLTIDQRFWTAKVTSDYYALPIAPEVIAQFPTFLVVVRGEGGKLVELALAPETYFKEVEPGTRTFSFRRSRGLSILGQVFMENHYVEFDRENKRIGFAPNASLCSAS